jgi:hypothetical protein
VSITIKPVRPALAGVQFGLTDFETISGGVGGWETLDRPRRASAAGWVGLPSKTIALPLILDGMEAGGRGIDRAVEADCATVTSWGKPHRKTGQPPILQVRGTTTVSTQDRWVVQDIAWGPYITNRNGKRVQQELTITLLQYVEASIVRGPAAKARNRQKHKHKGGKGKGGK